METRPLRTLALWCPDWPVTAAGADLDVPVAILEGEGARRVVTACSPAARENGVRRGQRVRDAQRLCPQLVVYRRDEAREAREFEPIAAAAEDLAASIEVVRPGLITLDARGPARYYGGERPLADLVRDTVAELATASGSPIGCGVGIADGPFAAALAARRPAAENAVIVEPGASPDFLAPYPVAVLDRPALAGTLDRLGIRTLGAFAALSGPDVAGRFGVEGLLAHRLARGLDPRPPAARRPADDLSAIHEFDPPAERDEPVAFAGKALADRLHATLAAAGVACTRLGIDIVTASGRGCYRLWRHGDALGGRLSALAVAERVRWQLDGWRTRESYPVADPVVVLRLIPDQLVVDRGSQQALWGSEQIPDRVNRAAERVQGLLGHEGVRRPLLAGGRDPASQVSTIPWGELPEAGADPAAGRGARGRAAAPAPWPGAVPPPAPPLLPAEPHPAELRTAGGGPVGVTGRARLTGEPALLVVLGERLEVTGWAGPWVYNESWWDPLTHRRRARLQCVTADGRAWLLAVEGGKWRVEGVYG
ncbi:DNA polymerase Y family protein [Actinocrinis puniceicyclus]|uniref:DNA polymerase Y family protein n=1 Tax=Actinocrinis puniceicyclus TaxID=977794 RepID=A0A8J8BDL9_9ACTN|nr:DNA polymerase Y family protein [Actinocrinis puniceicyclus]MBS2965408.1 DNA polymerase Y family protein [Actinocrinis puniceicyclus]